MIIQQSLFLLCLAISYELKYEGISFMSCSRMICWFGMCGSYSPSTYYLATLRHSISFRGINMSFIDSYLIPPALSMIKQALKQEPEYKPLEICVPNYLLIDQLISLRIGKLKLPQPLSSGVSLALFKILKWESVDTHTS